MRMVGGLVRWENRSAVSKLQSSKQQQQAAVSSSKQGVKIGTVGCGGQGESGRYCRYYCRFWANQSVAGPAPRRQTRIGWFWSLCPQVRRCNGERAGGRAESGRLSPRARLCLFCPTVLSVCLLHVQRSASAGVLAGGGWIVRSDKTRAKKRRRPGEEKRRLQPQMGKQGETRCGWQLEGRLNQCGRLIRISLNCDCDRAPQTSQPNCELSPATRDRGRVAVIE